jgi:hypothetical protein
MKDRPILYTGEMVRQIIAGNKTNTRRPDKNGKPPCEVGDRLWIRETWRACDQMGNSLRVMPREGDRGYTLEWLADWPDDHPGPWRPSIHMPRAASRLSLEVLEVGRECLSAMSEADAVAEGVASLAEFRTLWDSIYGKTEFAWVNNPRVWSVEFRMTEVSS